MSRFESSPGKFLSDDMDDDAMQQPATPTERGPAGAARRGIAAIVLAAGRSTRMKSALPKVLHEVCGRPMAAYAIEACRQAGVDAIYVVVGYGKELVTAALRDEPGLAFVEQPEQLGSGHAVLVCADALAGFVGDVIVMAGDMPLVRAETLRTLFGGHRATASAASIATTTLDDPTGYGRIVRDADGAFERIVEHRDCTPEQLAIREVNPSYYCFDCGAMFAALREIRPDNDKGEYYLTDAVGVIRASGKPVRAATSVPAADATGINSRADLAAVEKLMQTRIQTEWMDRGVTIVDPATTWIDARARIGAETVIKPFSYVEGRARIGERCAIGPYAYVRDGAAVEDGSTIGPGLLTAFDGPTRTTRRISDETRHKIEAARRPPAETGVAQGVNHA